MKYKLLYIYKVYNGFIVSVQPNTGESLYLRSVRDNNYKLWYDFSRARSFSLITALKHARALAKDYDIPNTILRIYDTEPQTITFKEDQKMKKPKRFIQEYYTYKLSHIANNELMQEKIKQDKLDRLNDVWTAYNNNVLSIDQVMALFAEI